ncbi:hypothetical protein [Nonomuraea sp. NEAU-A123]|uniref:hypothetical protein n=1 Tax=Nonomuraea sp. NEAU-A123 TaxID=2839649 RepID=UPI001BE4386C|nr:hypothetical protein [Nonomuraea sp. NEAU-A123]MBT2234978.1 hypothetical protein [Nonomuraea sp. NEAU-A123]
MEPKISPRQAFALARPNHRRTPRPNASQPSLIPSRAAVLSAVPEGMRRATSQRAFLRAVKEHPDALALKCHAYRNLTEVAGKLADWADWTTLTTRPTEQRIADDLDLALSTVKRWIRWLRERGFLGVVEEGTTNRFRRGNQCGLTDDGLGNRAAVWVLCTPIPELDETDMRTDKTTTEPPSLTLPKRVKEGPTHAREERSSPRRSNRISTTNEAAATPGTRKHALQVAQKIHDESTTLGRLSPWYIRHLTRVFVAAGWTAADVLHALDHQPDGAAWTYTWTSRDQIRNTPGWVRFRLSAWLDEHGRPLPGKSQRLMAAAAQLRAERAALRERFEEMRARRVGGPVEPPPRLSRAEALAGPPVAEQGSSSGPGEAYRAARAALDAKRLQREAERLRWLAS